jgi:predicted dehydrogenase
MRTPVAIIGLGAVADRIHLPACRAVPEIEVIAACDPEPAIRSRMARKFRIPRTYSDVAEMLAEIRPAIVLVGSPPSTHFSVASQALERGAHVLCEKPFMPTLDEADRIIDLARARKRLLRVNNQYRFMSFYRQTKERLDRGDFGRLFYIQVWQQMFHPPAMEKNWRSQLKQSLLYEFGTHALDLISFFFDALPESLSFHMPRCRPEFDSDVVVNGALRFAGERLATLSLNRVTHAPEKYLEMRLDCERASIRISLGGVARLGVEWSGRAGRPVIKGGLAKGGQAREERGGRSHAFCTSRSPEFASATAEHLRILLAEARQGESGLDAARHSREILGLALAGYESARSGETIWISKNKTGVAALPAGMSV